MYVELCTERLVCEENPLLHLCILGNGSFHCVKRSLQYPSCLLILMFTCMADLELTCQRCIDCEVMCSQGLDEIFLNVEVCVCGAGEFMWPFLQISCFMEGFYGWVTASCLIINLSVVVDIWKFYVFLCLLLFSFLCREMSPTGNTFKTPKLLLFCAIHMCCVSTEELELITVFMQRLCFPTLH